MLTWITKGCYPYSYFTFLRNVMMLCSNITNQTLIEVFLNAVLRTIRNNKQSDSVMDVDVNYL